MGTLYWQLNDCWPVTSWSSIDYFGRWKALHYFTKKAFDPVLLSCEIDEEMRFYVINDSLNGFDALFEAEIIDFEGNSLWQISKDLSVKANQNQGVYSIDSGTVLNGIELEKVALVMRLIYDERVISRNIKYLRPVKELELPIPNLEFNVDSIAGGVSISIRTDKLAKNVYLTSTDPEGFFSDNFFDILPGETINIRYSGKYTEDDLLENISTKTINEKQSN